MNNFLNTDATLGHDEEVIKRVLGGALDELPVAEALNSYGSLSTLLARNKDWQKQAPGFHERILERHQQQEDRQSRLADSVEKLSAKMAAQTAPTPTDTGAAGQSPQQPKGEVTFCEWVKEIIRKAATKNGQVIKTRTKGHEGAYIYFVDDVCFCRAMDDMLLNYGAMLKEFLCGALTNIQLTKVCFFIGRVLDKCLINAPSLRFTDVLFAFEDHYPHLGAVRVKLSTKDCAQDHKTMLETFGNLLLKYKNA